MRRTRKFPIAGCVGVALAIAFVPVHKVQAESSASSAEVPVIVKVDDDAFVGMPPGVGSFARSLGGPGLGFVSLGNSSGYASASVRIRIVQSPTIGRYLPGIRAAAASLSSVTGLSVQVDETLIADRPADFGEVLVRTSFTSPCGSLNGGPRTSGVIGCGGPFTTGTGQILRGEVYLQPDFYCSTNGPELVAHELGHAFGLGHYDTTYGNLNQMMRSSVSGVPTYRAGDRAGLRALAGLAPDTVATVNTPAEEATAAVVVAPPAGPNGGLVTAAGTTTGSLFTQLASPLRILDTRSSVGSVGPLFSGDVRTVTLPAGLTGSPFEAVTLNITVTGATGDGYVSVWPSGEQRPNTSVLNYQSGHDVANSVIVKVSAGQSVDIYNFGGPAQVLGDFGGGWSVTGTNGFVSTDPVRLFDTRSSTVVPGEPRLPLGCGNSLSVSSSLTSAGVPAIATANLVNITAIGTNGSGFVSITPTFIPFGVLPPSSTLNVVNNDTRANLSFTPTRDFFVRDSDDLVSYFIGDLAGYFVPVASVPDSARFVPVSPQRQLDTRSNIGAAGKFSQGTTRTLALTVPAGFDPTKVVAVAINLTVTDPDGGGYLTAYPAGTALPNVSNLNFRLGETIPGLAVVKLGSGAGLSIFTSTSTHVIGDVMGYFVSP